ncbi:hypothetical protein [Rhizobium sp. 18055]|uniref:hypothetical protein n=1 Tax=Rhizobium sp. 18055 TaxID=2681403 RepID=UPI001356D756|nr:hypothetical protein [Rhizobium sp. 18055]
MEPFAKLARNMVETAESPDFASNIMGEISPFHCDPRLRPQDTRSFPNAGGTYLVCFIRAPGIYKIFILAPLPASRTLMRFRRILMAG